MKYKDTKKAIFIDRPNRFIANVEIDGKIETVHVKNTGRCKELLLPGVEVILEEGSNPARKTKYDLIGVKKAGIGWINIDSQVPNTVVKEWLYSGKSCFGELSFIKPECVYGDSRVDFYMEQGDKKIFMEVKGCTLEIDGEGYFPDAPTQRGVKHIKELVKAKKEGYESYLAFVIAMNGIKVVHPNDVTHKEFGAALREAVREGLKILYLQCMVTEDELNIISCDMADNVD